MLDLADGVTTSGNDRVFAKADSGSGNGHGDEGGQNGKGQELVTIRKRVTTMTKITEVLAIGVFQREGRVLVFSPPSSTKAATSHHHFVGSESSWQAMGLRMVMMVLVEGPAQYCP
jgi:hypothetical protein